MTTTDLTQAIRTVKEAMGLTEDEAWGPPIPNSPSEAFQLILTALDPYAGVYDERTRSEALIAAIGDYQPA